MSGVYSTRLLSAASTDGDTATDSYEVPSGLVVVVVCIAVFLDGAAGASAEVYLEDPTRWIDFWSTAAAGVTTDTWTGRVVCNEGETIACDCSASSAASLLVSGYTLSGV